MLAKVLVFVVLGVSALGVLSSGSSSVGHASEADIRACRFGSIAAHCGTLTVPRNRDALRAGTIALHFVVLTAKRPGGVPVFPIAGGPGQSMLESAAHGGPLFDRTLAEHDIVLVDQRGTGRSHALPCALYTSDASTLQEVFPLGAVRACHAKLTRQNDLNDFGTTEAADDIDAVRVALNYKKIIVVGGSYGTTVALVYLRRHDRSVENAVLLGVSPPFFRLPLPYLRGAQHALEDLERACAADGPCHSDFPNFASEFRAVTASSRRGLEVDFRRADGERVAGTMSFSVFADRMRQALYSPSTASVVPFVIHRAFLGDTTPLAKVVIRLSRDVNGALALGQNFSVTCAEGVPFIEEREVEAAAWTSFMSDTIVRARQAVCKVWKVRPVDRAFLAPVSSNVPVLMISGSDDPATPESYGARQLAYLPNGRQLVIQNGGHELSGPCIVDLQAQFMATSDARALDASCASATPRPPFARTLPPYFDRLPAS